MPGPPSTTEGPRPLPLALDPARNVRLFAASHLASVRAARAWLRRPDWTPDGPWCRVQELPGGEREVRCDDLERLSGSRSRDEEEAARAAAAFRRCVEAPGPVLVVGVVNVTPDSFSDGGQWLEPGAAVEHALRLAEEGADVVELGAESTRPGAADVPADEELRRLLPVLRGLRKRLGVPIAVDTRRAVTARACLEEGATWVNDVSGLTHDPALAAAVAEFPGVRLVLMHSLRPPSGERYSTAWAPGEAPEYEDVVADTLRWLRLQTLAAVAGGVDPDRIWIDPGFGFSKKFEDNVEVLRRLREFTAAGLPVLVGTSRKSTIGRLVGDLPVEERLEGTLATVAWCAAHGASAVRVHDVKAAARTVSVVRALR